MATTVVNLRKDHYQVYIGRGSPFGNQFVIGKDGNREQVIAKYKDYFVHRVEQDAVFRAQVLALRDKVLGCYCWPLKCHGNVIIEWLDTHKE